MLEFEIEYKVNRRVEPEGLIQVKLGVRGRKGWPDRMYLYRGRTCFVEFKKPGEKPEPLQNYTHDFLRQRGFKVWVIDDIDQGVKVLLDWKHHVDSELA